MALVSRKIVVNSHEAGIKWLKSLVDNNLKMPVFKARQWTGEVYDEQLAALHPERDWILSRILWLSGLEPGFNAG